MRRAMTKAVPCNNPAIPRNRALQEERPIMAQRETTKRTGTIVAGVRMIAVNPAQTAPTIMMTCISILQRTGQVPGSRAGISETGKWKTESLPLPFPWLFFSSFRFYPIYPKFKAAFLVFLTEPLLHTSSMFPIRRSKHLGVVPH